MSEQSEKKLSKPTPPSKQELTAIQIRARRLQATADFIARKGEWIKCTGGHRICQVAQDIPGNSDYLDPANFENWEQIASEGHICSICGSAYADGGVGPTGHANRLHFGGGWR